MTGTIGLVIVFAALIAGAGVIYVISKRAPVSSDNVNDPRTSPSTRKKVEAAVDPPNARGADRIIHRRRGGPPRTIAGAALGPVAITTVIAAVAIVGIFALGVAALTSAVNTISPSMDTAVNAR